MALTGWRGSPRTADGAPEQAVLIVGQTQAEAEAQRATLGRTPLVFSEFRKFDLAGHRRRHRGARPITCSIKPQYVPFASSETTDNPGSSVR